MSSAPDPTTRYGPPSGPRPSGLDSFFDSVRRVGIVRTDDRWIGGVSGGFARRLGIDVALVRGIFVVLGLFGGVGLVLYGVAWALLPEERDGRIHVQEAIHGNVDGAIVGAIALVIVGLGRDGATWSAPLQPWGNQWSGFGTLLGVLVTIAVVTLVIRAAASGKTPGVPAGPVSLPRSGGTAAAMPESTGERTSMTSETAPDPGAARSETGAPPGPGASYPTAAPAYPGATHAQVPPSGYGPPVPPSGYGPRPVGYNAVPPPSIPRKAPVHGPGATTFGVVAALTMLITAGLLIAERADVLSASPWTLAAGAFVVLIGIGIVVAGFRGRSSGYLGFIGIVAIVCMSPMIAWTSNDWSSVSGPHVGTGTMAYAPVDRESAASGYSLGVGENRIDLTEVPLTDGPLTVPLRLGVGDLIVTVPHGASVRADVQLRAGEIDWKVGDDDETISGTGLRRTFESLGADSTPDLVLDIRTGVGQITIKEDR